IPCSMTKWRTSPNGAAPPECLPCCDFEPRLCRAAAARRLLRLLRRSDFTGPSELTVTGVIKSAMHGRRPDIQLRGLQYSRQIVTPVTAYLNMLLVDHGIFRVVHLNQHRLSDKAWRSAQPAPHQIRALAQRGIRTIVNLRGERPCGSYW